MTVGDICCREVDLADVSETVQTAGSRMAARNVGSLLVLDAARRPVGILTDRDLALRVVGLGRDPNLVAVGEVMTRDPATVSEDAPVERALERMRGHSVRRLPVVGSDGRLVGILSLDDVLGLLIEELGTMRGVLATSTAATLVREYGSRGHPASQRPAGAGMQPG